jgi:hypothetical protein
VKLFFSYYFHLVEEEPEVYCMRKELKNKNSRRKLLLTAAEIGMQLQVN